MTNTTFRRASALQHAVALSLAAVVTAVVLQGLLGLAGSDHAAQLAQQKQTTPQARTTGLVAPQV